MKPPLYFDQPSVRVLDGSTPVAPPEPVEPKPVMVRALEVVLHIFGGVVRCFVPPRDKNGEPLPQVSKPRTLSELCDLAEAAAIRREQEEAEGRDDGHAWIRRRNNR
jgi:hypothetical protein